MKAEGRDPWRSLVKAAAVVQSFANRIMIALYGGLERVLHSIARCMRSGCRASASQGPSEHRSTLVGGLRLGTPLNLMPMGRAEDRPYAGYLVFPSHVDSPYFNGIGGTAADTLLVIAG
jgi:hypothetical protein